MKVHCCRLVLPLHCVSSRQWYRARLKRQRFKYMDLSTCMDFHHKGKEVISVTGNLQPLPSLKISKIFLSQPSSKPHAYFHHDTNLCSKPPSTVPLEEQYRERNPKPNLLPKYTLVSNHIATATVFPFLSHCITLAQTRLYPESY